MHNMSDIIEQYIKHLFEETNEDVVEIRHLWVAPLALNWPIGCVESAGAIEPAARIAVLVLAMTEMEAARHELQGDDAENNVDEEA